MNFGVIGEPCVDFIIRAGKETKKCFGGILYSVLSLSVLSNKDDRIYPIMYAGYDEYDNLIKILSGFENIQPDFVLKSGQKMRTAELHYDRESYEREEIWSEPMPPVEFDVIEKVLPGLDAMLVNMISGSDITLATLERLRKNFANYIHIDIHNLVMQRESGGKISPRPADDWLKWCTGCTTVQMNETEAGIISGRSSGEYETAEKILTAEESKTEATAVTRGVSGVSLYLKKNKTVLGQTYGEISKTDIAGSERQKFQDSTGCGDVFAAAFCLKNAMKGERDYVKAARFANRIAGMKTEFTGAESIWDLRFEI